MVDPAVRAVVERKLERWIEVRERRARYAAAPRKTRAAATKRKTRSTTPKTRRPSR
jgi:hypothetical protein